tara:strand:- start:11 stop:148 length:138 start_codon:yes stop_codon:yes gene_type:complete
MIIADTDINGAKGIVAFLSTLLKIKRRRPTSPLSIVDNSITPIVI